MKIETQVQLFSETLSGFISALNKAKWDYNIDEGKVYECDLITQDYLHQLESGDLSYEARAEIATQISDCRKTRRKCKNEAEILEPLMNFLYDENNKRAVAELEKVLERTRKVEAEIGNCTYEPLTLESEGSE